MLKVELHIHTGDDPVDLVPYSTHELIDRAADLGYAALAITLHERQLDLAPFRRYARERGIVLIPGVERTICGKHVLLLNFPAEVERVQSFEEVAALKAHWPGLVIAPHPFYPAPHCLGRHLSRHAALFDAVEFNYYYTRQVNVFNEMAVRWARAHGKPIVANTDVHRLDQLGPTCTLVDAEPHADAICDAIRAGRVTIRTEPISNAAAISYIARISVGGLRGRARRWIAPRPAPAGCTALTRHLK
jgi:hypothetical protein